MNKSVLRDQSLAKSVMRFPGSLPVCATEPGLPGVDRERSLRKAPPGQFVYPALAAEGSSWFPRNAQSKPECCLTVDTSATKLGF